MADYIGTAIAKGDHWVIDLTGVGTTTGCQRQRPRGHGGRSSHRDDPHPSREGARRGAHRLIWHQSARDLATPRMIGHAPVLPFQCCADGGLSSDYAAPCRRTRRPSGLQLTGPPNDTGKTTGGSGSPLRQSAPMGESSTIVRRPTAFLRIDLDPFARVDCSM
jgi:hypothetical protein